MFRSITIVVAIALGCLPIAAAAKAGRLSRSFVVRSTEEVRSAVADGQGAPWEDIPGFSESFTIDHTATVVVQGNLVVGPLGGPVDVDVAVAFDGVAQEPALRTRLDGENRLVAFVDAGALSPGTHTVSVQWRAVPFQDPPVPPDLCVRGFARRMVMLVY